MTLSVVLAMVIPAGMTLAILIDQAGKVAILLTPWVKTQVAAIHEHGPDAVAEWVPFREELILYAQQTTSQLGDLAGKLTPLLLKSLQSSTSSVGSMLLATLDIVFFVYAFLFFLLTGRKFGRYAVSMLPLSAIHRELLVDRSVSTIRATVKGSFVIALVQGGLTGLGLAVTGVPLAIFWSALATICSVIPLIGPPLVWVPAALWLFAVSKFYASAGLFAWGTIFVSTSDNILRPVLIGKDAKLSDMTVLLSTLGGMTLFGAAGILIGPLIASLFAAVWHIYRVVFDDYLEDMTMDEESASQYALLTASEVPRYENVRPPPPPPRGPSPTRTAPNGEIRV